MKPYDAKQVEHRERDKRRAAAAGIQIPKEHWEQPAEQGRDLVHELASEARVSRGCAAHAERAALLEQARGVERVRRQLARDDLRKRARERLASPAGANPARPSDTGSTL